jgi:hypothetical protein
MITTDITRIEHEVQDYVNNFFEKATITIVVHGMETVTNAIAQGSRFFTAVCRDGMQLYSANGLRLNIDYPNLNPATTFSKAQKHYYHRFGMALGFLESAGVCYDNGFYSNCMFELHQAVVNNEIANIIHKSRSNAITLKEFCGLPIVGVKTGFNEGFITDLAPGPFIKSYVFGRDIKKYQPIKPNNNIIFSYDNEFKIVLVETEKEIYSVLNTHKQKLSNRAIVKEGLKNGTKCWYEYQQVNKSLNYDDEYIVYPNVSLGNNFTLTTGAVIDMTAFLIKSNSRYLLAILNSKLIAFLMDIWSISRRGGYLEYKVQYVEKIPIKNISFDEQQTFIKIVDQILEAKKQDRDTTTFEQQIDALVYQLYELTPAEIAIVENSANAKANAPEVHLQDSFE